MKHFSKAVATIVCLVAACYLFAADSAKKEARVTRIVNDVQIMPANAPAEAATLDELVQEKTGVRTGDESRSELTFEDLTITRLGANTIFSFDRAGRTAELAAGTMLLRVPKNSGGATIKASAVTVGITGTTVIFGGDATGNGKLIVLEGSAQMRLNANPKQSKRVTAGEMLDVKAGAKVLPNPVTVDIQRIMDTDPLITDFPPLPSQDLIVAAMTHHPPSAKTRPVYQGKPVSGQPVGGPPVVSQPVGPVGYPPPGHVPMPPRYHPTPTPTPRPKHKVPPRGTVGRKPTPTPNPKGKPVYGRPPRGRATPTPTPPVIH
jgi:hypothetical protein